MPHVIGSVLRRLRRQIGNTDTGTAPVQTSFRWMAACICWRLGFRQFSFHHIPRVPQHPAPVRLGTTAAFLGEVGTLARYPISGPFPASPLPNPPCEFPRNGLSSDYAVSDAVGYSAWMAWWQIVQTTRVLRRRFAMS